MMALAPLKFVMSAPTCAELPPDSGREVVFAGRSNAGKSSAINAVFGARSLARVSKQPGRTQAFNVFELAPGQRIVDLPGYGFAQVPAAVKQRWEREIPRYFTERRSLEGVVLIMDVRHPFKAVDEQFLALTAHLPVLVVLSKCDKLSRNQQNAMRARAARAAARCDVPEEALLPFSAVTKQGVDELRAVIADWLDDGPAP